jgi:ribosomal protein L11 methylase PrmA
MSLINAIPSSYKDPSGFIFLHENEIYRQVNLVYKDHYDRLMQSGLYEKLVADGDLIAHHEIESFPEQLSQDAYKTIKPDNIPFISYPYEWCFNQLKDAALLTLKIQKVALNFGLILKDASSYNVQFLNGRPIFIDSLSFEKYEEGKPWVAYKQFCEHFLAPLALAAYTDEDLNRLSQLYVEGVPLELAAKLLPLSARLKPALFLHIFLHAREQKHFSDSALPPAKKLAFNRNALLGLIDNLESGLKSLKLKNEKTIWTNYCDDDNCVSYDGESLTVKKKLVGDYLTAAGTKTLWDLGANTGLFSRIAASQGIKVISLDFDVTVIEQNYLRVKKTKEKNILPLLVDIVNPTPAIGWHNQERLAFLDRPHPDTVLALALIHHLAISKNVPLVKIAQLFADIAPSLIIEFVPKDDRQTKRLLHSREDIFIDYDIDHFEQAFKNFFEIKEKTALPESKRFLYLMIRKS